MVKIGVGDCLKSGFKVCEIWVVIWVRVFTSEGSAFIKSGDAGGRWEDGGGLVAFLKGRLHLRGNWRVVKGQIHERCGEATSSQASQLR